MMLAQLAESYVASINMHAVPTISTAWERVLSSQLDQVSGQAIDTYRNAMQIHITLNMPVDEDTVRQVDKDSRQEVQCLISRIPVTSANKSSVEAMREEITERLDEIFGQVCYENLSISRKVCQKLMQELLGSIEKKLEAKESFHWFVNEWSRLHSVSSKQKYLEEAKGPAKYSVGLELAFRQGSETIAKLVERLENMYGEEVNKLRKEVVDMKGQLTHEKGTVESRMRQEKQRQNLLEGALEEAKQALNMNSEQFGDLQHRLQEQNRKLKLELEEARRQVPRGGSSLEGSEVKTWLDNFKSDLLRREEDRGNAQVKYDYDMKLQTLERTAQQQLLEARRTNDIALQQLKKSYNHEINALKDDRQAFELQVKELEKQLVKRDMTNQLYKEKLRAVETEKKLRVEHADLLCSVSDLVLKFLQRLEGTTDVGLRREISELKDRASRISQNLA
jgi:hypothetical protein